MYPTETTTKPRTPLRPEVAVPQVSPQISTDQFNTRPLRLAPTVPQTGAQGLEQFIASNTTSLKNSFQQEQDQKLKQQELEVKSSKSGLMKGFQALLGQPERNEQITEAAGVDEARKQVDEYTSQIEAEQLSNRRRIEALEKNNPEGLFGGALEQEVRRINNESVARQADLAILQSAATRRYDTAASIADRKIQVETEGLKTQLDALKFFYNENKEDFTKTEERQFQQRITEEERAYKETVEQKKTLSDTKLQLLTSASQQGAPTAVLNAIQSAASPEDAIVAAGRYGGDILAQQLKRMQIAKLNAEVNPNADPTTVTGNPITDLTSFFNKNKAKLTEKESSALGVLLAVNDLANSNPEGNFKGLGAGQIVPGFALGEKGTSNRQYVGAIDLTVQQWASGASLTEKQTKQVDKLVPKTGDNDKQIRNKLNGLANYMLGQIRSGAVKAGVELPITSIKYDFAGNSEVAALAEQKGFDIEAAKAAGYTDEEIKAALNQ